METKNLSEIFTRVEIWNFGEYENKQGYLQHFGHWNQFVIQFSY